MANEIRVHRAVLDQLLVEARREPQFECCGLLAGGDETISEILPAQNALASPTAFEIAPRELFDLFRRMRAGQLNLLGIYHSHPHAENRPSPRDVAGAFYPDAAHFILSPLTTAPYPIRAFRIREGQIAELVLRIV